MFRLFSAFILVVISLPSSTLSQERSVFVTPLCSYDTYRNVGFDNGFNAGASVSVHVSSWLGASFAVMFGSQMVPYDVVGGTQSLTARTASYTVSLSTPLFGEHTGAELAAVLGGGILTSSVDPRNISVGALGTITIPARSESRGILLSGFSAELPLSPRIAITVEPTVRWISPMASSTPDYSIAGGLRVGIF